MEPVSNQRLLLSGNGVPVQGCVVRQGIPVSVYPFYDLLAIGITNQVAFDVKAVGVYFLAVPAVAHQILGNAPALLKVKIPIAVGKQQTPLPGLYGLGEWAAQAAGTPEWVGKETDFLRQRNRIGDALAEAADEIERCLARVGAG